MFVIYTMTVAILESVFYNDSFVHSFILSVSLSSVLKLDHATFTGYPVVYLKYEENLKCLPYRMLQNYGLTCEII